MSTPAHGGGCLCGGVRYQVIGRMRAVVYCHCNLCRVQGSTATVGVARRALRLLKWDTLRSYNSSIKARRWFCGSCGAAMYWDPIAEPFVAIFAGSLDQPTGLEAMAHIYVAERPDYTCISDHLKQYAGPMDVEPEPLLATAELEPLDDDEVEDTAVELVGEDTAPDRRARGTH